MCYGNNEKKAGIGKLKDRMKTMRYALVFGAALAALTTNADQEPFKVLLEAKWENLDSNPQRIKKFGGKWILVGSITFKKRSSEVLFLDEIQLTWEGDQIPRLTGSLYQKNDTSAFLPIEKYFLCDSLWKSSTQQMLLKFHQPITLGSVNTLYLVLTVPEELENKLKKGKFKLEHVGLPMRYRQYVEGHSLSIALNDLHQQTAST